MRTLLLKSLFARPVTVPAPQPDAATLPREDAILAELGKALEVRARRLFGRSITIREVDAGSCNGCELEIHALNNAVYDVERFGIKFAASPRHADVLLVTGPVTHNMRVALERTYAATPDPKWVVAVGDCAAGCGVFAESYATVGSVDKVVPVDLVHQGLSAAADRSGEGAAGADGAGDGEISAVTHCALPRGFASGDFSRATYSPAPSLPTSAPSRTTNCPRTMVETGQPFTLMPS